MDARARAHTHTHTHTQRGYLDDDEAMHNGREFVQAYLAHAYTSSITLGVPQANNLRPIELVSSW